MPLSDETNVYMRLVTTEPLGVATKLIKLDLIMIGVSHISKIGFSCDFRQGTESVQKNLKKIYEKLLLKHLHFCFQHNLVDLD